MSSTIYTTPAMTHSCRLPSHQSINTHFFSMLFQQQTVYLKVKIITAQHPFLVCCANYRRILVLLLLQPVVSTTCALSCSKCKAMNGAYAQFCGTCGLVLAAPSRTDLT